MKRILCFIIIYFISLCSFSQVNMGIIAEAGMGCFETEHNFDMRLGDSYYLIPKLNWTTGAYVEYYFASGISVQLNAVYSQVNFINGFQVTSIINDEKIVSYDQNYQMKIEGISFPISVGYKFKRLKFAIGGQYSMFYKSSSIYNLNHSPHQPVSSFKSTSWKFLDYDLGLTSVISCNITDRISINALFNRGLRNISNMVSDYDQPTYSKQFMLGVKCDIVQLKRETGKPYNGNRKQKQLIGSRIIEKKQMFDEDELEE